jgi:hypothetical protein
MSGWGVLGFFNGWGRLLGSVVTLSVVEGLILTY